MPVIAALMEENKLERMKIYNNIDDQKRMYVDRWKTEIGNYFRDNRKTADELITHMRETYADYMNAYNMYQSLVKTSSAMKQSGSANDGEVQETEAQAEMLAGFEAQAAQCNQQQEAFAEFMDRINDSIDESTKQAVVAMQTAVIASEKKSADKICDNVDKGFYNLIHSQISMKLSVCYTEMQAKPALLMEYSKTLAKTKERMEGDYNRVKGQYKHIFKGLDKSLSYRIAQLDKETVGISETRKKVVLVCLNAMFPKRL